MKDRFGNEMPLTEDEAQLLTEVKRLFAGKGDSGSGAGFREAFVHDAMEGYCMACGERCGSGQCFCMRDD